ncbi:MAG: hypothetical protein RBT61_00410 [Candidatus Kapabacteria bacterium]|nr:hypothetical protein [Candidatus Kapabacteria bacterium]
MGLPDDPALETVIVPCQISPFLNNILSPATIVPSDQALLTFVMVAHAVLSDVPAAASLPPLRT